MKAGGLKSNKASKVNNYMSATTNNSPSRHQAMHPTYQKLADLKQSKEGIETLLDKARKKKPSRALINKQHNTSSSPKSSHPITSDNLFNKRKASADQANRT